jgi:thiol-disulfide isomerase/thioredoxin
MRSKARAGLLVILLTGVLASCNGAASGGIGVAAGFNVVRIPEKDRQRMPSFHGSEIRTGGAVSSASLAGKVGVVNFWGTWCGPCRREQPALEAMSKEYSARGVVFLGVNARRDQQAAARAYLDDFHVTYPSIFNPDSTIAFAFRVRFMPATFVIDRNGRIAAEVIGALRDESDLRAVIDPLLS